MYVIEVLNTRMKGIVTIMRVIMNDHLLQMLQLELLQKPIDRESALKPKVGPESARDVKQDVGCDKEGENRKHEHMAELCHQWVLAGVHKSFGFSYWMRLVSEWLRVQLLNRCHVTVQLEL